MNPAESEILAILRSIESAAPTVPPTILYNEGWLLRLVLAAAANGACGLPFLWQRNSRWFSEALLPPAFLPRHRGDHLAESFTHADAVIGQFAFADSKGGVVLVAEGTQFVVCEAKIFSSLSAGTTRAPQFDQAARNVACMAEALRRAGKPVASYDSLGFFVLAPESQIRAGVFDIQMGRENIRSRIGQRVKMYETEAEFPRLDEWLASWVEPLVNSLELKSCSWESLLDRIAATDRDRGADLRNFYSLCLKYNAPAQPSHH